VTLAQKDLLYSGPTKGNIVPICYRPFDIRHTYYTGQSRGFIGQPQQRVMRQMLNRDNLALIVPKRVEHVAAWQHAFVTDLISNHVAVSLKTVDYHFPLYFYSNVDPTGLFAAQGRQERRPNLNHKLLESLTQAYRREPLPEEVFNYIYAVLYAPKYREKYADFLHRDFPRVPFTANDGLFDRLSSLGARLSSLHVLKSPEIDPPVCRFEGEGDSRVGKGRKAGLRYAAAEQRVYVNRTQFFAPVREDIWSYHVGGYQVCEKWLKDRQERRLELDDIRTYCRIVTAIGLTIEIQATIDPLYADVEKSMIISEDSSK
jgi:predicted helicase